MEKEEGKRAKERNGERGSPRDGQREIVNALYIHQAKWEVHESPTWYGSATKWWHEVQPLIFHFPPPGLVPCQVLAMRLHQLEPPGAINEVNNHFDYLKLINRYEVQSTKEHKFTEIFMMLSETHMIDDGLTTNLMMA